MFVRYTDKDIVTKTSDYFVAPFAPDGELIEVSGRTLSELSPKWLDFCRGMLATQGETFRCNIPLPPLQHIALHITSSDRAALVSLSVHSEPASSAVALRGTNPAAETEILRIFVESMRRVPLVQQASSMASPFEAVFSLSQRPLYVVIPWANPRISEGDQQLVLELETHLAAVLLVDPPAA